MNTCHFYRVPLLRAALLLMAIGAPASASATSFELDVKDLQTVAPAKRTPKRKAPAPAASAETKRDTTHAETKGGVSRYTVKPGDFIFKILMREYGLSNAAAEALIPEIQRINNLRSITSLSVGQTILIPLAGPRTNGRAQETDERRKPAEPAVAAAPAPPEPSAQAVAPSPTPPSEQTAPPVTEAATPVPPGPSRRRQRAPLKQHHRSPRHRSSFRRPPLSAGGSSPCGKASSPAREGWNPSRSTAGCSRQRNSPFFSPLTVGRYWST